MSTANRIGSSFQADPAVQMHILVVDDDPDICRLNVAAMISSGYTADGASDGAAAWSALQFNHYDLLITDQDMPKLSGIELLLKLHAACMMLPVILVTGLPSTERLKRCPWLHIDAILPKPYAMEKLLVMVKGVLYVNGKAPKPTVVPPILPRHWAARC